MSFAPKIKWNFSGLTGVNGKFHRFINATRRRRRKISRLCEVQSAMCRCQYPVNSTDLPRFIASAATRFHLSSSGWCNDRSFPALLARRSAVRVLPHQRIHNGFGEPVRVPGCVALTGSDAGNVPTKPAIKFPSISRSALAASLGSSGCLSSGAGLNFSTM